MFGDLYLVSYKLTQQIKETGQYGALNLLSTSSGEKNPSLPLHPSTFIKGPSDKVCILVLVLDGGSTLMAIHNWGMSYSQGLT